MVMLPMRSCFIFVSPFSNAVILRSALLRASRRMAASACGPSFEARREERRAPQDDGGVSQRSPQLAQQRQQRLALLRVERSQRFAGDGERVGRGLLGQLLAGARKTDEKA